MSRPRGARCRPRGRSGSPGHNPNSSFPGIWRAQTAVGKPARDVLSDPVFDPAERRLRSEPCRRQEDRSLRVTDEHETREEPRGEGMSKLLVVTFDDEKKAYEGSKALADLHREGSVSVYSAAVVSRDADGKVSVKDDTLHVDSAVVGPRL